MSTPRAPLTVAACQPGCAPRDVAANVVEHASMVRRARSRLVAFPELSLTGYHFATEAVDPDDRRLEPLVECCTATGTLALVGAPVPAEGGTSIGILAVDDRGVRVAYRKMYLGSAETTAFVPGTEPAVVEVDGWRIGLAVCKDTGVVEHSEETAALGIDVLAAGVLEHAGEAHVVDERAARITTTHDVWTVVASFAGRTGEGYEHAAGRSGVWRPDGSCVARAGPAPGDLVRARIDP